jgi:hypothetical protein
MMRGLAPQPVPLLVVAPAKVTAAGPQLSVAVIPLVEGGETAVAGDRHGRRAGREGGRRQVQHREVQRAGAGDAARVAGQEGDEVVGGRQGRPDGRACVTVTLPHVSVADTIESRLGITGQLLVESTTSVESTASSKYTVPPDPLVSCRKMVLMRAVTVLRGAAPRATRRMYWPVGLVELEHRGGEAAQGGAGGVVVGEGHEGAVGPLQRVRAGHQRPRAGRPGLAGGRPPAPGGTRRC